MIGRRNFRCYGRTSIIHFSGYGFFDVAVNSAGIPDYIKSPIRQNCTVAKKADVKRPPQAEKGETWKTNYLKKRRVQRHI